LYNSLSLAHVVARQLDAKNTLVSMHHEKSFRSTRSKSAGMSVQASRPMPQ